MAYTDKVKEREWYRRYRQKRKAYFTAVSKASIAKKPEFYRAKWRRNAERLTDCYVRAQLSRGTRVPRSAWPAWLVTVKRAHLKLKRKYGINQNHCSRLKRTDRGGNSRQG